MNARWEKYTLRFKQAAGTSRGTLTHKETYFLSIFHENKTGLGECNLFKGLSADDFPDYENKLDWLCANILLPPDEIYHALERYPSIIFGWEQALANLNWGTQLYYPSAFTNGEEGILINGLIWMGDYHFMQNQIEHKLQEGYSCLKLKIGMLEWPLEKKILAKLRQSFSANDLEIRVDANGAFKPSEVIPVLEELSHLQIHSIEQPIKSGQINEMKSLCAQSPIPIALDEELIGITNKSIKKELLEFIKPAYVILKPSLLGGYKASEEWISIAEKNHIGWWITSALESNIGLNAIAQWTYTLKNKLPQGLGTGELYTNNIPSPIYRVKNHLYYDTHVD